MDFLFLAVALLQFPVYGFLLSYFERWKVISIILIAAHAAVIFFCFASDFFVR